MTTVGPSPQGGFGGFFSSFGRATGLGNFFQGTNRGRNEFRQAGQFDPAAFTGASVNPAIGARGNLAGEFANRGFLPGAAQSGFRGGQQQFIGQLQNQFMGHGPGQQLAAEQARLAQERNLGQQQALLASGRNAQSGLGARSAALGTAIGGQGAAQAGVMGGLQAQLNAGGLLGNALGQARGQDQSLNQFNAQFGLQNRQLNDQNRLAALAQQNQLIGLQQGGVQGARDAETARFAALMKVPTINEQILGAGLGAAQTAALGDVNAKQR